MSDHTYEVGVSRVAYEGQLSRVRVDEVRMPDGRFVEREVVEHLDAVAVVALDDQGRVVLLRQHRHPVGARVLELPAGKLDVEEESPLDTARRELREEVGIAAQRWELLVRFHNSAGWSDESTTIFLAEGLSEVGPPEGFEARHEESDMEVERVPLEEAVELAEQGAVVDAKTLIGLLLAARKR